MKFLKKDQVALTNFPYYKHSLTYTLDSLERVGAKNIEFYAAAPHFYLGDATTDDIKLLKRQLRAHHLQVINLCPENCTYPVNIASSNLRMRQRCIEHYTKAIHAAHEWESPYCLFFPGFALADEEEKDAWQRGAESMAHLARIAEVYGVQLILEAAPKGASLIHSTDRLLGLIDEVGSDALTGMIDLTCILDIGETVKECIDKMGIERIRHIHFHNCEQLSPGRWEHRLPLEGVQNLEEIVRLLDENRFTGHFGCEVFAPYESSPEEAMIAFRDWFATLNLLD